MVAKNKQNGEKERERGGGERINLQKILLLIGIDKQYFCLLTLLLLVNQLYHLYNIFQINHPELVAKQIVEYFSSERFFASTYMMSTWF